MPRVSLDLELSDGVATLTMNDVENRFRPASLREWHAALDHLDTLEGPLALVVTGVGKFFCNGVAIDEIDSEAELAATVTELRRLLARLLVVPAFSVCAINGHAFGAGAILTCAFDYRVMRTDRGYWCVNEAAIGFELDEGLMALVLHRLERRTARDAVLCATRYDGPGALAARIVDALTDDQLLLRAAHAVAHKSLALDRTILARNKRLIHGPMSDHLRRAVDPTE